MDLHINSAWYAKATNAPIWVSKLLFEQNSLLREDQVPLLLKEKIKTLSLHGVSIPLPVVVETLILENSLKFPEQKCEFLEYYNALPLNYDVLDRDIKSLMVRNNTDGIINWINQNKVLRRLIFIERKPTTFDDIYLKHPTLECVNFVSPKIELQKQTMMNTVHDYYILGSDMYGSMLDLVS